MKQIRRKGLGRGLDVLLDPDSLINTNSLIDEKNLIEEIEISSLVSGKYQPRQQMDETSLHELAQSIKEQGVLQPILVRKITAGKYEIIAGERRTRAAKLAGFKTIAAIVKDINDKTAAALALIENIQRENLNVIDEAVAFERLITEFRLTHEQIAKTVGKSRSSVSNSLRLLQLADPVKLMVKAGDIDMGHARAILVLPDSLQEDIAQEVINKKLSVRDTEKLVKLKTQNVVKKISKKKEVDGVLTEKINNLSKVLNSPVKLKINKTKDENIAGNIVIKFKDSNALDRILKILIKK